MATAAMAQMNVRLEKALKEEGDAALESVGLTPTEVVRSIWKRAAKRGEGLVEVLELVRPDTQGEIAPEVAARLAAFERGTRIIPEGLQALGISQKALSRLEPVSDDEALWQEMEERMEARLA